MNTAPYLAEILGPTARNTASAEAAFVKARELAYTPRKVEAPEGCTRTRCGGAHDGYPGSEHLWALHCELCGEDVAVYPSHMRRNKRHRGCTFAGKRAAAARAARYRELGLALPAWDTDAAEAPVEAVVEGEARAAEVEAAAAPVNRSRSPRPAATAAAAEDGDQESDLQRRAGADAPARRVVVVSCGGRKADGPAVAGELYTGSYHRAMRRAADALTRDGGRVLILSARYGLVELDELLAPYELRLGDAGAVSAERVREQAEALGVADEAVTVLGGRAYVELAREVWVDAEAPLAGSRGICEQLGRLARIYRDAPAAGHVDHIERDAAARHADQVEREARKRAGYVTASPIRVDHHGRASVRFDFPRAGRKGAARSAAARRFAASYGVEVHTVRKLTHYNPGGLDDRGPVRDELALDVTGTPEAVARFVSGLPRALDKVEALTSAAARHYGRWERHSAAEAHLEYVDPSGRRALARTFRAAAFDAVVDTLLDPPPVEPSLASDRPAWELAEEIGQTYALYGWVDVADQADADEVEQLLADADRALDPAAVAFEAELGELLAGQARRAAALYGALDGEELLAGPEGPGEAYEAAHGRVAAREDVLGPGAPDRPAEIPQTPVRRRRAAGRMNPETRPRESTAHEHHAQAGAADRPAPRRPRAALAPAGRGRRRGGAGSEWMDHRGGPHRTGLVAGRRGDARRAAARPCRPVARGRRRARR